MTRHGTLAGTLALACITLSAAPLTGALAFGGAAGARAAHALPAGSALIRVAETARTQISGAEVRDASKGVWKGKWDNDASGGSGELTIRVASADGGALTGSGEATGGACERTFAMTGWYRESLVEMTLEFPAAGADCPAATVMVSARLGRQGEKTIGIGHWANVDESGKRGGQAFGVLQMTRQ